MKIIIQQTEFHLIMLDASLQIENLTLFKTIIELHNLNFRLA